MLLIVLLFLLTYISFQIRFSILTELHFISNSMHNICLNLLPQNPKTQATLQALICGHNFENFETAHLYTSSGLIHLFVVSGSHLILIYKTLNYFFEKLNVKKSKKYIYLILFIYAAVCLFNPPITRSLIGLFVFSFLKTKIKYWSTDYTLLLIGVICLILSPVWISSISLQMSWLAALSIEVCRRYLSSKNDLFQQIPFYLFYCITFSALGFPQFAVVVIAFFLTPVLEYILLPFAFLVLAFPFTDPAFEIMMTSLNFLLSHFELSVSLMTTPFENSISLNWILIFLIHFILHFKNYKT